MTHSHLRHDSSTCISAQQCQRSLFCGIQNDHKYVYMHILFNVFTYVYIHLCMYMYVYVYYTYMCIYLYVYVYTCLYVWTYIHIWAGTIAGAKWRTINKNMHILSQANWSITIQIYAHTYMYRERYIPIYKYIHIHIYMYTFIHVYKYI